MQQGLLVLNESHGMHVNDVVCEHSLKGGHVERDQGDGTAVLKILDVIDRITTSCSRRRRTQALGPSPSAAN